VFLHALPEFFFQVRKSAIVLDNAIEVFCCIFNIFFWQEFTELFTDTFFNCFKIFRVSFLERSFEVIFALSLLSEFLLFLLGLAATLLALLVLLVLLVLLAFTTFLVTIIFFGGTFSGFIRWWTLVVVLLSESSVCFSFLKLDCEGAAKEAESCECLHVWIGGGV